MRQFSFLLVVYFIAQCIETKAQTVFKPDLQEPTYQEKTVDEWIKQATDANPQLRLESVHALAKIGLEAKIAIPPLIKLLRDNDEQVRSTAHQALRKMGQPAVTALTELLHDKNLSVRTSAAQALEVFGPDAKSAVPALAELLGDSTASFVAAYALGSIGPEARYAIPKLIALLQENNDSRSAYASALGHIGPEAKAAVPEIIKLLHEKDISVHYAAIAALGGIGPGAKDAIPDLIVFLPHLDTKFKRNFAAEALIKIGPPAILPLTKELKNKNPICRYYAAYALGQIGPDAKTAIPALTELLNDEDLQVRSSAAQALTKIQK
jgi:HEAT repeat protein